jgi:hypothetical protein
VRTSKSYTKSELKVIRDMSLTDSEVSAALGRSKQAIYCKRWVLRLKGPHKKFRVKPKTVDQSYTPDVSTIVDDIVKNTTKSSVERVILGNVTIDLVSKTLTIKF